MLKEGYSQWHLCSFGKYVQSSQLKTSLMRFWVDYYNSRTCVPLFSWFRIMLFNLRQQILLYHEDSKSKQLHMESKGIPGKINICHLCSSLLAARSIARIHYPLRSLSASPLSLETPFSPRFDFHITSLPCTFTDAPWL